MSLWTAYLVRDGFTWWALLTAGIAGFGWLSLLDLRPGRPAIVQKVSTAAVSEKLAEAARSAEARRGEARREKAVATAKEEGIREGRLRYCRNCKDYRNFSVVRHDSAPEDDPGEACCARCGHPV